MVQERFFQRIPVLWRFSEHPPAALLEWRIFHPGRQNGGPHAPALWNFRDDAWIRWGNQRNKSNLKDNHLIKTTDAPLTFGEYRNVFLTEKEYKQLQTDFSGLDSLVEQLSAYIQSTGKKYSDHAATLCIWAKRQKLEQKQTPGIPDYTFKKGESL